MITIGIIIACVLGVVGFILYRSERGHVVVPPPVPLPSIQTVPPAPVEAPAAPVEPLTVTPAIVTNWQREVDPGAGKEKL